LAGTVGAWGAVPDSCSCCCWYCISCEALTLGDVFLLFLWAWGLLAALLAALDWALRNQLDTCVGMGMDRGGVEICGSGVGMCMGVGMGIVGVCIVGVGVGTGMEAGVGVDMGMGVGIGMDIERAFLGPISSPILSPELRLERVPSRRSLLRSCCSRWALRSALRCCNSRRSASVTPVPVPVPVPVPPKPMLVPNPVPGLAP